MIILGFPAALRGQPSSVYYLALMLGDVGKFRL